MRRRYALTGGPALLVLLLDQLSKWWVMEVIPEYRAIVVIPGFFDLVNIRNRGAAFGFLNRSDIEWQFWLFMGATLIAVWAIVTMVRNSSHCPLLFTGLGLVLGGAVGNLIDRLRFRAVVDFLDLYWGSWHWPAFNIADMGICLGAFLSCLAIWRQDKKSQDRSHKETA